MVHVYTVTEKLGLQQAKKVQEAHKKLRKKKTEKKSSEKFSYRCACTRPCTPCTQDTVLCSQGSQGR